MCVICLKVVHDKGVDVLTGENILCFAPDPWSDIWRNRHQIMSVLAERNDVLYVEPRLYLRSVLRDIGSGALSWSDVSRQRVEWIDHNLYVYHQPLYAPLSGREPLKSLTQAVRGAEMRRAMHRVGMDAPPILWLYRPDMADLPGRYGERLLIYHIVDEYLGYTDVDSAQAQEIRRREEQLITQADLVLVTSQALLETKGGINPNTHWVPNAVDYERFERAVMSPREPSLLQGCPRPRIAYVGAINDKIDGALLAEVALDNPGATLVLVGPVRVQEPERVAEIERLRAMPNVMFVGQVPVEQVPYYMVSVDVGLLPYCDNAWTRHIHPLKLYEYMACGLPVVATDLPSLSGEKDLIHSATDPRQFVANVRLALEEKNQNLYDARRARAAQNTWRHRVERISELVSSTIRGV